MVCVPTGEFLMGYTQEHLQAALQQCRPLWGNWCDGWAKGEVTQRVVNPDDVSKPPNHGVQRTGFASLQREAHRRGSSNVSGSCNGSARAMCAVSVAGSARSAAGRSAGRQHGSSSWAVLACGTMSRRRRPTASSRECHCMDRAGGVVGQLAGGAGWGNGACLTAGWCDPFTRNRVSGG